MSTTAEPQLATDEKPIGDRPDLESALETREKRKNSKNELVRQFKEADDRVRALLSEFELAEGEVARIGRFRIEKKAPGPSREVAFEVTPKSRLVIKADEDG